MHLNLAFFKSHILGIPPNLTYDGAYVAILADEYKTIDILSDVAGQKSRD